MERLNTMRVILRESTEFLSDNLRPEDVLRGMLSGGAITNAELEEIRGQKTDPDRVEKLLAILNRKPLSSYNTFMVKLKAKRPDLHQQVKELEEKHQFNPEPGATSYGPVADIYKEANKMQQVINCPYLVRIIGFIDEPEKKIIMPYYNNGNLRDFNREFLMVCQSWPRKMKMIKEITLGMSYLHSVEPYPIIHADLKLANIFVEEGLKVKIGDFGLSISTVTKTAADLKGTITHMPPEGLDESVKKPDKLWDIFTFGITLYEFVSRGEPYGDSVSAFAIGNKVMSGKRPDLAAIPSDSPEEIIVIMKKCWDGERNNRPQFHEIQESVTAVFEEKYEAVILEADRQILDKMTFQKSPIHGAANKSRDSGIDSKPQHSSVESNKSSSDGVQHPSTLDSSQGMETKGAASRSGDSGIGSKPQQSVESNKSSSDGVQHQSTPDSGVTSGKDTGAKGAIEKPSEMKTNANLTASDVGEWQKEIVIRNSDNSTRPHGIAWNQINEDIFAADPNSCKVFIYNAQGKCRLTLSTLQTGYFQAFGAVYSSGRYFVTGSVAYVKYYNAADREYCGNWMSVKPGQNSENDDAKLDGICVDAACNLLVGDSELKYISKHTADGKHIGSFNVDIRPTYLAVTGDDNVIISGGYQDHALQIVNQHGSIQHRIEFPNGMRTPQGVCFHSDVIYVCGRYSAYIYCFSQDGSHIANIAIDPKEQDDLFEGCNDVTVTPTKMIVSRGYHPTARIEVYVHKK